MMFLSSRPLLLAVALLVASASGHVRWSCPTPRSTNSAIKSGPCGTGNDNTGFGVNVTELRPGPLTVAFQETIGHRGSPFRIALSREGEDEYEECILLNHIPHYDAVRGNNQYAITIDIPDVQCNNCALQLIQFMTDKIGTTPDCEYEVEFTQQNNAFDGERCHSNYHSCANVRILGSTPRNQFQCAEPADWPFTAATSGDPFIYLRSEPGIYGAVDGTGFIGALAENQGNGVTEPGIYGAVDGTGFIGTLAENQGNGVTVPARFNTLVEGCGNVNIRDNTIEAAQVSPVEPEPEVPEPEPTQQTQAPVIPPVVPEVPETPDNVLPEPTGDNVDEEDVVTRPPPDSSTSTVGQTPQPIGGDNGLSAAQGSSGDAISTHTTAATLLSIVSGVLYAML